MWQFPWCYKESIAFSAGLLLVGIMLQLTLGSFNFYLLHSPANIIAGVVLIAIVAFLTFVRNNPFVKWIGGISFSVTLIGTLLIISMIMGLIPQYARVNTDLHIHWEHASIADISDYYFTKLGLKQITTSWPFVLLYTVTLISLGLVIANRLHQFKIKDYAFYLNHLGLWILLFAAGFGSADMLRFVMYVNEGDTEWRVYDSQKNVLELDIAIKLHNFRMEEYVPKLAIVNKFTGDVQPENRPAFYQIDENKRTGYLDNWNIELKDYIHEAVRKTDTTYQYIPMTGSMPAAKIKATNELTGKTVEGWVTCGSVNQFVRPLDLDSLYAVVMTKPEPKRFASDITVMTNDDSRDPIRTVIEVNKPLKMGDWVIYQYDYDHELGKASRVSGFELVYDPWLNITYIGVALLALGSVSMLWIGNKNRKKKEKKNDVE